jgi:hypothetical protein
VAEIVRLVSLTMPNKEESEHVWDAEAIQESLLQLAKLRSHTTGYVYADRDRGLKESRLETQSIYRTTLFLLRTKAEGMCGGRKSDSRTGSMRSLLRSKIEIRPVATMLSWAPEHGLIDFNAWRAGCGILIQSINANQVLILA